VTLADADRDWPAIASALESGGVSVLEHEKAAASLEDVFLERAGGRADGSSQ